MFIVFTVFHHLHSCLSLGFPDVLLLHPSDILIAVQEIHCLLQNSCCNLKTGEKSQLLFRNTFHTVAALHI